MEPKPPTPVCKSFLICRQVFEDKRTREHIILGPTLRHAAFEYPAVASLAVFAHWTSAHGVYYPELQLQDLEGHVLWREVFSPPMEVHNPLEVCEITISSRFVFPRPGKYDIVMLANGEEVMRSVFWSNLGQPRA